jgi:hypothetical protein
MFSDVLVSPQVRAKAVSTPRKLLGFAKGVKAKSVARATGISPRSTWGLLPGALALTGAGSEPAAESER